jgi:ketosteroid isomerase-like protein
MPVIFPGCALSLVVPRDTVIFLYGTPLKRHSGSKAKGIFPMNRTRPAHALMARTFLLFAAAMMLFQLQMRPAAAAGAVAMQVERIIKIAIMEYNSAMRDGDAARWTKYFTDNVKRNAPQASQEGMKAFSEYYAWEFANFDATWTTKRMIISGPVGAVELEWDAVHKASGSPVKVNMVAIFELASSGKFQSVDFYFDSAELGDYLVAAKNPG